MSGGILEEAGTRYYDFINKIYDPAIVKYYRLFRWRINSRYTYWSLFFAVGRESETHPAIQ